jgi:hypothetical protein
VFKDPSNTDGKKFANRKLRRRVKQAIHNEEEDMPLHMEVMNQYDLIDFKETGYRKDDDEKKRMKRK